MDTINVNKLNVAQQANPTDKTNKDAHKPPSYFRRLIAPENLPNLILCVIGIAGVSAAVCTLRVISRQTKATTDAAKAAADNVRLQEILNQQWVQVDGWRRHGGSSREQSPPRFRIAVDIGNPTNNPLTIIGATITAKGQTRTHIAGTTLGPQDTPILIETDEIILKTAEIAAYEAYNLPIIVTGEIVYRDIFEKDKIQSFGQLCVLGPNNHFRAMPFYQMRVGNVGE